ncbi:MAG: uncharacterized protein JWN48_779 [Myxococcaceae bacterium]|nr:uncharacterized protein [Myxococcaceae bacterium]
MKQSWPAPERNKEAILEVLKRVLPDKGTLLELASGSGQHVSYFAEQLPQLRFVPSDIDPNNLASIRAYAAEAGDNVLEPREIDVRSSEWAVGKVEAIFCANMIHIAPWSCAEGLLDGVARNLTEPGVFVLYGPFRFGGVHTSQSNVEFDRWLKAQDPAWGVRDADDVAALAQTFGLTLDERVAMPANNYCLVFRR